MSGERLLALFVLAMGLVASATPALAADEDTQLWLSLNTVVPVSEATSATVELSSRFRQGPDQLLTRATVETKLSYTVSVGLGTAYVVYSGGHEVRPSEQVTITAGKLAFRTRLEERLFAGAERAQLRLRQRVQAAFPLAQGTRLVGSGELLYIGRPESSAAKTRVDSWRAAIALQKRLTRRFDASVGYLLIYSPRTLAPDRISHVPQLTLTLRG